jgi:hypothetical protein
MAAFAAAMALVRLLSVTPGLLLSVRVPARAAMSAAFCDHTQVHGQRHEREDGDQTAPKHRENRPAPRTPKPESRHQHPPYSNGQPSLAVIAVMDMSQLVGRNRSDGNMGL